MSGQTAPVAQAAQAARVGTAGTTGGGTAGGGTAGSSAARSGRTTGSGGPLASRTFWAGYGVLLAVMGTRLPMWSWPPRTGQIVELAFCAVVFAGLAQPYVGRPVLPSMRLHRLALVHRNTLLPCAFVLLVAGEKPQAWAAGADALLLTGYLVLTDVLTVPPHVLRRISSPAFLLALVAAVAGTTALLSLRVSGGAYRPVLVAAAAAAALGAALATAFGRAEERRVGSRGTERRNQDRSSE